MFGQDMTSVTAETLRQMRDLYAAGRQPLAKFAAMSPGVQALLAARGLSKAQTTANDLVGYYLEPTAKLLQPVLTPLRNRIPRVPGSGGLAAHWKQILSLDVNRIDIFQQEGVAAPTINYTASDQSATYRTFSMGDSISIQSKLASVGLEDGQEQMVIRLLKNVMILEERGLIGGNNGGLGSVTAPTLTTATTGGTLAAQTWSVIVRARTALGLNYTQTGSGAVTPTYGRGRKSTNTTQVTTGATSTISATTPWVEGAAAYDWYLGTAGNEYWVATTPNNSYTFTAAASGTFAVPADNHADANAYNGLITQLTAAAAGYMNTLPTGTPGVGTPFTLSNIDTMLLNLFSTYFADPEVLVMAPQQCVDFTNKVIATGDYRFNIDIVKDEGQIGQFTGGFRANRYLNKATGTSIEIVCNPWWPQGNITALSLKVPFPAGNIVNAIEIENQLDYFQLDYAVTAPQYATEVMTIGVLKLYFLIGCGVIRNIVAG